MTLRSRMIAITASTLLVGFAVFLFATTRKQPVEGVRLARKTLVHTLITTARVDAPRVTLSAMGQGRVSELRGDEGELVEEGALLVRLAAEESEARVAEANAQLKEAVAQRRTLSQLQLKEAAEALSQAETRLSEARADAARQQGLAARGAVAQTQASRAQNELELRTSAVRSARTQLASLKRGGAQALQAEAAVARAEAAVSLAQAQLDNFEAVAPTAGRIAKRHVEVGDAVMPGSPLLDLIELRQVELVADIDERNLAKLAVGQAALAAPEAFPDTRMQATLTRIAPTLDATRGTVEVRFTLAQAPDMLRPDMTVALEIEVARKADALSVPSASLRTGADGPYVLVARQGKAVATTVSVGLQDLKSTELLGGVTEGDVVIVSPEAEAEQDVEVTLRKAS